MRELPWAWHLKKIKRRRGAPGSELSELSDDVVVEGTWAEVGGGSPQVVVERLWYTSAGRRMDSDACRSVRRRDPRTCARRRGESTVLDEGRPTVGQVQDQGLRRVAGRFFGPGLVFQGAALLQVLRNAAKWPCLERCGQSAVGRAQVRLLMQHLRCRLWQIRQLFA